MPLNPLLRTAFLFIIILTNCTTKKEEFQKKIFTSIADSLAQITQKHLLINLNQAISSNGYEAALSYCNEKATDLSSEFTSKTLFTIQRISAKARNPQNQLSEAYDKKIWEQWQIDLKNGKKLKTITYKSKNTLVFYKPILLGMQACLNCHGNSVEIPSEVASKIEQLYPDDKAVNFKLNDLRGFWKVTELN
jgi:hypothetical protein